MPKNDFMQCTKHLPCYQEVVSIDFEADQVKLASGETYPYEQLIVATGSTANRIPVDGSKLKNIFVMRTVEDAGFIDAGTLVHSSALNHS